MKQLVALALVFSLARPAWPEELRPPPPPPDDEVEELPPEAPQAERAGYYDSCFGVPRVGAGPFGISGEVVIPVGGGSSGAPPVPVSSGSSDEKAWLVALELRPLLLIGSSLEPSLEAAFLVPLAQILHLRAGGRVYTFAGDLHWNLSTGLSLTL